MSPEEVKMSKLSAEVTLAEIGTTAERIRILTAHVPRHAPVKINDREVRRFRGLQLDKPAFECDPRPTTFDGFVAAARKAVSLASKGEAKHRACQRAGLTESHGTGVAIVLRKDPLFLDLKVGRKPNPSEPRHNVSFIRWFLGINCESDVRGGDTEALRDSLKRTTIPLSRIVEASGVHPTTIQKFRNGTVPGMRPETRAKLWEAIK